MYDSNGCLAAKGTSFAEYLQITGRYR